MKQFQKVTTIILSLIILFCIGCGVSKLNESYTRIEPNSQSDYFSQHVKPIFDNKCIACHSCFNSPCQLKLSSYDGAIRGANEISIFDVPKLRSRKPTRLFIDHHSVEEWRERGFFPVLGDKNKSLMSVMVSELDGIESGKQKFYDSENSRECMSKNSPLLLDDYEEANPAGRMPFGFPALSSEEINKIKTWQELKLPGPDLQKFEKRVRKRSEFAKQIEQWEEFLNQKSMKNRIVSRYIYEHLFLAHIYFNRDSKTSFRLVRSKTRSGDIEEIGTLYPYDSAGDKFYYRLRPVVETMMHKRHIPFAFTPKKLKTWKENFIQSQWKFVPKTMPEYGAEGSNPFKTFASIPVKARYKFFLDESAYHIMTFIKGPVCRGQTAVNVINDHFWVLFLDPEKDPLVNSQKVYSEVTKEMKLPAKLRDRFAPMADFRQDYWDAVRAKFQFLSGQKLDESWIWNGDKKNLNSVITVMRHYDSAHVMKGMQGRTPKTVWVLDYHVFESIYYNLTAGYNMFGPVLHQVNSRLFMEISRIASEDLFLSFLATDKRKSLRGAWNLPTPDSKESELKWISDLLGHDAQEEMEFDYPFYGGNIKSTINGSSSTTKEDFLNFFQSEVYSKEQMNAKRERVPKALKKLESLPGRIVADLPDSILIRFEGKIYTLVHHMAHLNVSMIFFEDQRRVKEDDRIDIMAGVAGSYPNLLMSLDSNELLKFYESLKMTKGKNEVAQVLQQFGVTRDQQNFWDVYKWFSERTFDASTLEFGHLDLNRYEDFGEIK